MRFGTHKPEVSYTLGTWGMSARWGLTRLTGYTIPDNTDQQTRTCLVRLACNRNMCGAFEVSVFRVQSGEVFGSKPKNPARVHRPPNGRAVFLCCIMSEPDRSRYDNQFFPEAPKQALDTG